MGAPGGRDFKQTAPRPEHRAGRGREQGAGMVQVLWRGVGGVENREQATGNGQRATTTGNRETGNRKGGSGEPCQAGKPTAPGMWRIRWDEVWHSGGIARAPRRTRLTPVRRDGPDLVREWLPSRTRVGQADRPLNAVDRRMATPGPDRARCVPGWSFFRDRHNPKEARSIPECALSANFLYLPRSQERYVRHRPGAADTVSPALFIPTPWSPRE